ncbi:MAG: hypothetical protein Q4C65_05690 [Eubacteriales bacterium]|nr:hypothetical protein [Eubacteriales bacterium]
MKNQWKKLALAVGCSLLVLGQVPVTVHAEETVATQAEVKATLKTATDLEWDGKTISFNNPNSDEVFFSYKIYRDGATVGEQTGHAGHTVGQGKVYEDVSDFITESGEYTFEVRFIGSDYITLSDWSGEGQPYQYDDSKTKFPTPTVTVEADGTIKVSVDDQYALGTDYKLEYVLYANVYGGYMEAGRVTSDKDTYNFGIFNRDYPHFVKVKVKSLKVDMNDSDTTEYIPVNSVSSGTNNTSSSNNCNHDYEWVQVNPATATEDALEAYTCKHCGRVSEYMKAPNTAYAQFNKDAISAIDKAAANATVTLKTNMWVSFYDSVIDMMKKRPDVTVVVNYFYKGTRYVMTIPAGADLSALQASEGYYGFRYLDGFFPAQVEK